MRSGGSEADGGCLAKYAATLSEDNPNSRNPPSYKAQILNDESSLSISTPASILQLLQKTANSSVLREPDPWVFST